MDCPQDGSWELADSLLRALSAPLPPDSRVAASYKGMMQQLQTDVASALLACADQPSMLHTVHVLADNRSEQPSTPTAAG